MATQVLAQPRYLGNTTPEACRRFAGGPEQTVIKEAASQSYGLGALVYLATTGLITIATATTYLFGQALQAATGVTNTSAYVARIRDTDIFAMNVYHGTIGSAITALAQLGAVFGVVVVNGQFHVDLETAGETTAGIHVKVIGFYDEDALGDTYGRVKVQFEEWSIDTDGNPAKRILQGA